MIPPSLLSVFTSTLGYYTLYYTSGLCQFHPLDWVSSLILGHGAAERSYDTVLKRVDSGDRLPGFEAGFCHLLAM